MATEVENNTPAPISEESKQEDAPPAVPIDAPAVEAEKEPAAAVVAAEESKEVAKEAKDPAPKKPTVHKVNFEKDVVYLYQFARTPSLPSLSPYVLKVETWLRLVGLKYEVSDFLNPLNSHSPINAHTQSSKVVLLQVSKQACEQEEEETSR